MTAIKKKQVIEAIGEGFLIWPLIGLFIYSLCLTISNFIESSDTKVTTK